MRTVMEILGRHLKYLRGENAGVRLVLCNLNEQERTDLRDADLSSANLSSADLRSADLSSADLSSANLSNAIGVLSQIEFCEKNFEKTPNGIIVYKSFGEQYTSSEKWTIEPGAIIEEVVNHDRTCQCACGINVATLGWCKKECHKPVWKCLIRWGWLAGVVVPYNTDGKIRAERIELIELINA